MEFEIFIELLCDELNGPQRTAVSRKDCNKNGNDDLIFVGL